MECRVVVIVVPLCETTGSYGCSVLLCGLRIMMAEIYMFVGTPPHPKNHFAF